MQLVGPCVVFAAWGFEALAVDSTQKRFSGCGKQGTAAQFRVLLRSKEVCQVNQCICQGRLEATWDLKPKFSIFSRKRSRRVPV